MRELFDNTAAGYIAAVLAISLGVFIGNVMFDVLVPIISAKIAHVVESK